MICDSMLEVAALLKEKGAAKIFMCATFGLFTNGLKKFDEAYEKGAFDRLLTTNLVYPFDQGQRLRHLLFRPVKSI